MSKKILLISTIYPVPDRQNVGTKVCHYFAVEWERMGYDVRVVHLQAVYPRPLYWIAGVLGRRISSKTGAVVYTKRDSSIQQYVMDGVPVSRIPVYKPIPHGPFSQRVVRKTVKAIIQLNSEIGFVPDAIIGHFTNPVIEVVGQLKKYYDGACSCVVVHGDIDLTKKVYDERLPRLMEDIDVWGFRCAYVRKMWEKYVAPVDKSFICYSGVPETYITKTNNHDFTEQLHNFIFVGGMIERKYPSKVLEALSLAYPDGNYHLNYVGEGRQVDVIRNSVLTDSLADKVSFSGKIHRNEIIKLYDKADCFIMISRYEAYGLVYLEAMARGCITIASRNEGFDGVIIDGVNGFLCKAGDAVELAEIVSRINSMSPDERRRISDKAVDTAKWLTDKNAAKMYIDAVLEK